MTARTESIIYQVYASTLLIRNLIIVSSTYRKNVQKQEVLSLSCQSPTRAADWHLCCHGPAYCTTNDLLQTRKRTSTLDSWYVDALSASSRPGRNALGFSAGLFNAAASRTI
jgi:hypothetical protein